MDDSQHAWVQAEGVVLIAEQLMLLLLDPERGELEVRRDATDPDRLAAAAILLDLAEQRNLGFRGGHVAFLARFPSGHPVLTAAADVLRVAGPGLPMTSALDLIETRVARVSRSLLEGLHRRDLLHRQRRPAWWPWAAWKYPLRSSQARNEALAALRAGSSRGVLREYGLLLLIDCAGRLPGLLDAAAHTRAAAILLELGHHRPRMDATDALLGAMRTALLDD